MRFPLLALLAVLLAPLVARADIAPPIWEQPLTERSCDGSVETCGYGDPDFAACDARLRAAGYESFGRRGSVGTYCRPQDVHAHVGPGVFELAIAFGLVAGAVVLVRRRRRRGAQSATASSISASPTNGKP